MNTKFIRKAVVSTLLLTASAVTFAAGGSAQTPAAQSLPPGHGAMMMGMGASMGNCPMMGAGAGMDPKTALRMRGEMMRAMGDIMVKYSDQMGATPSK